MALSRMPDAGLMGYREATPAVGRRVWLAAGHERGVFLTTLVIVGRRAPASCSLWRRACRAGPGASGASSYWLHLGHRPAVRSRFRRLSTLASLTCSTSPGRSGVTGFPSRACVLPSSCVHVPSSRSRLDHELPIPDLLDAEGRFADDAFARGADLGRRSERRGLPWTARPRPNGGRGCRPSDGQWVTPKVSGNLLHVCPPASYIPAC
jgi:hypothetical protein